MLGDMAGSAAWYEDVVLPALLRGARRPYRDAVRSALAEAACDDMPRSGSFVVGGIARNGAAPLGVLARELGVSKQAAGALVDTLVLRGYVERTPDPVDRRRVTVTLTPRGELAAGAVRTAVERTDAAIAARVGAGDIARTRATLAALIELD